jgi:hypothetical protein
VFFLIIGRHKAIVTCVSARWTVVDCRNMHTERGLQKVYWPSIQSGGFAGQVDYSLISSHQRIEYILLQPSDHCSHAATSTSLIC